MSLLTLTASKIVLGIDKADRPSFGRVVGKRRQRLTQQGSWLLQPRLGQEAA